MKIVFFGTPPFAARTLESLLDQGVEVVGVVTRPDKPVGRSGKLQPPAVKKLAMSRIPEVPLFQPKRASDPESAEALQVLGADLFVVVAYGQIIKENLLEMPKHGCINVHASLLPKYRGAAPVQRVIMEGESETGVTIMHMAKELDAGDIIEMAKLPIGERTYGELEAALCELGCSVLHKVIGDIESGTATRTVQDHDAATYTAKITPDDGLVTFKNDPVATLCQIRGVSPRPGAWCWVEVRGERKRMKIKQASVATPESPWSVPCGDGTLALDEVQLEGKRAMSAAEFLRGYQAEVV